MAVPVFLLSKYCLVQELSEKVILVFLHRIILDSLSLTTMNSFSFNFHSFPWQESHSSVGTITVPLKHFLCLHYSEKDLRVFNASQEPDHAFRWKAFSKVLFYTDVTVNLPSKSNICSTVLKGTGYSNGSHKTLQGTSFHVSPFWLSALICWV